MNTLKESVIRLMRKVYQAKMSRTPLPGFVSCSKTFLKEEEDLPNVRMKEGFNPNSYKVIETAGYDFNNHTTLGKVIEKETRPQ